MERDGVIQSCHIGETEVFYHVPPTAADVLDWEVWIVCMSDPVEQVSCALQWLAKWCIDVTTQELGELLGDIETIASLCRAISASAGVPEDVLEALAAHLDDENGVPANWRPVGRCKCSMCRRDIESTQPCLYADLDPRVIHAAARIADVTDTTQRYYHAQILAVMERAESRRIRYEREDRENKTRTMDLLRNHPAAVPSSRARH